MGNHKIAISVVLPAYNEAENLPALVGEISAFFSPRLSLGYEIIVVDDGSKDDTAKILEILSKEIQELRVVTHEKNKGYGEALKSGFQAASKEWIFMTDSDRQFDISELEKFEPFTKEFDMIIGYRSPRVDPFMRKLNAWLFKLAARIFFGLNVRDIDCAFKLMRSDFVKRAQLESAGAIISMELLIKTKRMHARFKEIPVTHLPRTAGSPTGASPKVIWRAMKEFWKWRLTGKIK